MMRKKGFSQDERVPGAARGIPLSLAGGVCAAALGPYRRVNHQAGPGCPTPGGARLSHTLRSESLVRALTPRACGASYHAAALSHPPGMLKCASSCLGLPYHEPYKAGSQPTELTSSSSEEFHVKAKTKSNLNHGGSSNVCH